MGFQTLENHENQDQESVILHPQKCSYNILIQQVACGAYHTHLLSKDGFIYSMGSNQDGRLGLSLTYKELKHQTSPRLIETLSKVKSIASGAAHSIAIGQDYQAYSWGLADNGAIGMRLASVCTPIQIKFECGSQNNINIKDVQCGVNHSIFLTMTGEVYACGNGERGQLGIGIITMKEYQPVKVKFDFQGKDSIKQIECGDLNTAFLTEQGAVYITGDNSRGQLGQDSTHPDFTSKPLQIQTLQNQQIRKIILGGKQCGALTFRGDIYVWGPYNNEIISRPQKLCYNSQPPFKDFKITSNLLTAIDIDNNLWAWSSSQHSNTLKLSQYPSKIQDLSDIHIQQVFLGPNMIFAVGDDIHKNITIEPDCYTSQLSIKQSVQKSSNFLDSLKTKKPKKRCRKTVSKTTKKLRELEPQSFTICKQTPDYFQKHNSQRGHSQQPTFRNVQKIQANNVTPVKPNRQQQTPTSNKEHTISNQYKSNQDIRVQEQQSTIYPQQSIQSSQQKSFHYNYQTQFGISEQYSMIKLKDNRRQSQDQNLQGNISTQEDDEILNDLNIPQSVILSHKDSASYFKSNTSTNNKSSCVTLKEQQVETIILAQQIKDDLELKYKQSYQLSNLQTENQRLKTQLAVECASKDDIQMQLQYMINQRSEELQTQESYSNIKSQYDLLKKQDDLLKQQYEDQQLNLQLQTDKNLKLNDQLTLMKSQFMKFSDQLMDKEQELNKYEMLGERLSESEEYIDKLSKEKELREDELLNKMSTLADHYHKEKDKNQKLMSELQRQNEVLQKFEKHLKESQMARDFALSEFEKIQDEVARLRVEISIKKDKYKSFVRDIQEITPKEENTIIEQSRSPFKRNIEQDRINKEDSKKSESLIRLLRNSNIYERGNDSQNQSKLIFNSFSKDANDTQSGFNLTNCKDYRYQSQQKCGVNKHKDREILQKQDNEKYVHSPERRIQKDQRIENYNIHVLQSLERQAKRASQERKSVQSLNRLPNNVRDSFGNMGYNSFIRDHSPIDSHREIVSVLQDTQSTIYLQEATRDDSREAFKEIDKINESVLNNNTKQNPLCDIKDKHMNSENKIPQNKPFDVQSKQSIVNTRPINFSSNKKAYLKNLVDQELNEINQLINNPQSQSKPQNYFNLSNSHSKQKQDENVQPTRSSSDILSTTNVSQITAQDVLICENNFIKENLLKRFNRV